MPAKAGGILSLLDKVAASRARKAFFWARAFCDAFDLDPNSTPALLRMVRTFGSISAILQKEQLDRGRKLDAWGRVVQGLGKKSNMRGDFLPVAFVLPPFGRHVNEDRFA